MEQIKKKRVSLMDALQNPESTGDLLKKIPCALSIEHPCCKGKGYQLEVKGVLTQAHICQCVRDCLSCMGQAQKVESNKTSHPCVNPSPKKIVGIFNKANIPARYIEADLDKFSNFSGNGSDVVARIKDWVRNFDPRSGEGLSIGGSVGVGKTYLVTALAKELAAKGISVKFIDFFQLLAEIKAGYSDKRAEMELIAPLLAVDVLVLDEMGKGRNNDFEQTILDQLVMGRYNGKKAIVTSTNYHFKESASPMSFNRRLDEDYGKETKFGEDSFGPLEERIGERIFSRLVETTQIIELTGDNVRPLMSHKK